MTTKGLRIGELYAKVPVIQGGMGIGVSLSGLAGAVAAAGGIGVISTAQIGYREADFNEHPIECNLRVIGEEIKKAREIAGGGIIGANIMVATRRYEDYVKAAVAAGVDLIISGAGLPMNLPELVGKAKTKLAPIVSSEKSCHVILRYWEKKYSRIPDLVVIEGPQAGGHLGFSKEQAETHTKESYKEEIKKILELTKKFKIPTVMAGGIYRREDMEEYMELGVDGVQMATRFVTTRECDASPAYKQMYLDAKKEDIVLTKSPVGMPGRAIHNRFLDKVAQGERLMKKCRQCVSTCNPATTPYCITEALINAVEGRVEDGLIFCGSNAYKANRIETVAEIMEEFS